MTAPVAPLIALAALARGKTSLSLEAPVASVAAFAMWAARQVVSWTVKMAGTIFQLNVGIVATPSSQGRAEGVSGDANGFGSVEIVVLPLVIVLARTVRWGLGRFLRARVAQRSDPNFCPPCCGR